MTVIRFTDADGKRIGDVRVNGGTLDPDPAVASIAESWTRMGKTAAQFAERYRDWSNGYLCSRKQERAGGA